jgi:hypothetical protein
MSISIFRRPTSTLQHFQISYVNMFLTEVNLVGRALLQLACTTKCDNYTIIDFKIRMIRRMIDKLDNFDG